MRGVRLAGGGVVHHFGVAVVGGDQHFAAGGARGVDDAADADVERFHRLARGVEVAGVADHVAVRVVADDRVVLAALDRLDQLVGDLGRAHLGLQVVGGDLRRRHQDAVLAGVDRLDAAVEEVRDVRVFLGFGDAQLASGRVRASIRRSRCAIDCGANADRQVRRIRRRSA